MFGVYFSLDSIPLIPVVAMASGSKEGEFCVPPLWVLLRSISLVLAMTTTPLRTLGMS